MEKYQQEINFQKEELIQKIQQQSQKLKEDEISVMSFNLLFDLGKIIGWALSKLHPVFDKSEAKKKGVKTDWEQRKVNCLNMILENDPDIVGTQEGMHKQITYLREQLKSRNYEFEGETYCIAESSGIFYKTDKFRKVAGGVFWFSDTPEKKGTKKIGDKKSNFERTATWVHLQRKSDNKDIYCFNTHLDFGNFRMPQAEVLIKQIRKYTKCDDLSNVRVIVTGDFNTMPTDPVYKYMTEHLNNTGDFSSNTFHNWGQQMKILEKYNLQIKDLILDYIFASALFNKVSYKVIKELQGSDDVRIQPSDHYVIMSIIQVL